MKKDETQASGGRHKSTHTQHTHTAWNPSHQRNTKCDGTVAGMGECTCVSTAKKQNKGQKEKAK